MTAAITATAALLAVAVAVVPSVVLGQGRESSFVAALSGYQETPTLNSNGRGSFSATVDDQRSRITFRLTYSGLTTVTQAHIHLGARAIMGGIAAFLCGPATSAGNTKPACPASPATITGTIVPGDVVAIVPQGLPAGDFADLVRAVRAGATYANVHTMAFPAGEIRGQIGQEFDIRQDEEGASGD
ncbi:MAG: CHRD domain-containing protein [Chloroflexi bacterium]|nr:CHRD domain-containing protein [Chloroflexota bacterium]